MDAAYNEDRGVYSTAYVIYDPRGTLKAIGYKQIPALSSVLTTEVLAVRDKIKAWVHGHSGNIDIFSDSLEVVHTINTNNQFIGFKETSLSEVKTLVHNSCVKGVWFYRRKNNVLAHTLAQIATRSPHPQNWMDDNIPGHLLSLAHTL